MIKKILEYNESRVADRQKTQNGFSLVELLIVTVVLVFMLGVIISLVTGTQRSYAVERVRMEAVNDASAAVDMLVRLIRVAGNNTNFIPISADPNADGNFTNDILIRSDWNPENGALTNPFENIEFRVNNGVMQKRESSIDGLIWRPFLDNVQSLTFTYFDNTNTVIANPVANQSQIVSVRINLQTTGANPMTFSSTSTVRERRP